MEKENKLNVTVEIQNEQPGKLAPLVGYFPSGFDPNNYQAKKAKNPPTIKLYRNQKKTKRLELVVSPSGSNVDFVGTNYSGEAAAGKMCNYALGILDKDTKKLKIVPVAANKIFRLEPRVRGADMPDKELTAMNKADIIKLYGTKTQITKETDIDKEALTSTEEDTSRNIPPYNLSAKTPEKAYPLDQIIAKGEWDYLKDIFELLQSEEEITPDAYPSFVCNRVYKLELLQDEDEKIRLAGILSFITHLINFKDRHTLDGFSSSKHHKIPSMLFQRFTKMFVSSDRKRLSDEKIGALVSYVLVLTLIIDEFQTDFIDIARDLKMSALRLRPHFLNLGCKFKIRNKVTVATLPVPLNFPTFTKKRKDHR